jgi:thiamine pyrophosphokinase
MFAATLPLLSSQAPSRAAHYKVCADGGANRLHDEIPHSNGALVPDAIVGDLDSLRPELREKYRKLGVDAVDLSHDQDTTDLEKCVQLIQEERSKVGSADHDIIVACGVRLMVGSYAAGLLSHHFAADLCCHQ